MATPQRSELAEHVVESLSDLGPVRAKAMFGGYGLYLGDLMFGLIAKDVLYFKVDATTRPCFEAEGLGPFIYTGGQKPVSMSYHRAPDASLDDSELLLTWAKLGIESATRARLAPKSKSRSRARS